MMLDQQVLTAMASPSKMVAHALLARCSKVGRTANSVLQEVPRYDMSSSGFNQGREQICSKLCFITLPYNISSHRLAEKNLPAPQFRAEGP